MTAPVTGSSAAGRPKRDELPGLTGSVAERLGGGWSDGGLWDDVVFLARRFAAASGDQMRLISWHHLVLAAGNFSRRPGSRLRPASLGTAGVYPAITARDLWVPGLEVRLRARDPVSWQALSRLLPGAALPATTTILAALWPDHHVVYDWRVHAAANALRIRAGLAPTPDVEPASAASARITFAGYELVRGWVTATAARLDLPPGEVALALSELARRASAPGTPGRAAAETWDGYAGRVGQLLAPIQGGQGVS